MPNLRRDPIRRRAGRVLAGPDAPAGARAWLAASLGGRVSSRSLEDLRIIVSELVSNSVLHAGLDRTDVIRLTVDVTRARIVLSVRDDGCGFRPGRALMPPSSQTDGRGLGIVSLLSDRLLVDPARGQVTVEVLRAT